MHSLPTIRRSALHRRVGVVLGLLLLAAPRATRAQGAGIAVGAAAPGAAVMTLDGAPADLITYIGKTPVVLEFWATWCPLCKRLEPAMAAAHKKYSGRVTFISVGVADNQTAERQKAYAAAHGVDGVMLFDRDGHAVRAYAAPHTSYVVAIDKSGKVVYTGVGGEQDIDAMVARALAAPDALNRSADQR